VSSLASVVANSNHQRKDKDVPKMLVKLRMVRKGCLFSTYQSGAAINSSKRKKRTFNYL